MVLGLQHSIAHLVLAKRYRGVVVGATGSHCINVGVCGGFRSQPRPQCIRTADEATERPPLFWFHFLRTLPFMFPNKVSWCLKDATFMNTHTHTQKKKTWIVYSNLPGMKVNCTRYSSTKGTHSQHLSHFHSFDQICTHNPQTKAHDSVKIIVAKFLM